MSNKIFFKTILTISLLLSAHTMTIKASSFDVDDISILKNRTLSTEDEKKIELTTNYLGGANLLGEKGIEAVRTLKAIYWLNSPTMDVIRATITLEKIGVNDPTVEDVSAILLLKKIFHTLSDNKMENILSYIVKDYGEVYELDRENPLHTYFTEEIVDSFLW